jgi:hypothetical protein
MPLIEEKIGIGFAGIYPDKRCALARNVSRHDATKTQGLQRLFITAPVGIENNMVPLWP